MRLQCVIVDDNGPFLKRDPHRRWRGAGGTRAAPAGSPGADRPDRRAPDAAGAAAANRPLPSHRRSKNTACNAAESGHPEDSPCGQPDRGIRIVSEALANVAKHANAEMVMVSVEAGRGVLSLSVRDDGVGGADPDGSGLNGLRERPKRSAAH